MPAVIAALTLLTTAVLLTWFAAERLARAGRLLGGFTLRPLQGPTAALDASRAELHTAIERGREHRERPGADDR